MITMNILQIVKMILIINKFDSDKKDKQIVELNSKLGL